MYENGLETSFGQYLKKENNYNIKINEYLENNDLENEDHSFKLSGNIYENNNISNIKIQDLENELYEPDNSYTNRNNELKNNLEKS